MLTELGGYRGVGGRAVPGRRRAANAGYHIEGSYAAPDGSGAGWVNIRSRARGLLALFLFTDVGRHDAPTRLLCGSHLAVPQFLAPYGEAGTDLTPSSGGRRRCA